MAYKKWLVSKTDKQAAQYLAGECDIDPFVALIAASRGYTEPADLEDFLSSEPLFASPYELHDMDRAVTVINSAIENDLLIAVFGDYDCDGITSTALLYSYLKERGARVVYYIPDRFEEGYGMSCAAIDKLHSLGVDIIITVDNGISCKREVEYAATLGIQTVVTDHHLPPDELPCAAAVVDPHLSGSACEFKDISGVFVAFKLVCALDDSAPEQLAAKYSDLVAIGLISDVMPLKNENRDMVKQGLLAINNTSKMGIIALLNSASIKRGDVTASKIAFGISPRINAAGRMDNAETALKLLLSTDFHEASSLAEQLEAYNAERQKTEQSIYAEAVQLIEQQNLAYKRIIVVAGENWHKGVVGIVAARIVEKYGKPAIVLSIDENGEASGSGRSVAGFSLYDSIVSAAELLIKFGGHELAAGVSLKTENIAAFRDAVNAFAESVEPVYPVLKLDCKLNPAGMTVDLAEAVKTLEPFGMGNPTPIFGVFALRLDRVISLSNNKHSKLLLSKDGNILEAVVFGVSPDAVPFTIGDIIDIAVTIDVNEYGGKRLLSVIIKNWRISGLNEDDFFNDITLYERFKSGENAQFNAPTREEIGTIYRSLATSVSEEMLRQHNANSLGYFKTMIAIDVLKELSLVNIEYDGSLVKIKQATGVKANLADSQILKTLRGE